MRPLTAASVGLVFLVVDFRTLAVDLVPDPVGWALLAYALYRLAVPRLAALAGVGLLCSLAEAWLPYHYRKVETFQAGPVVGEPRVVELEVLAYDPVTGVRIWLLATSMVILAIVIVAVVRLLTERARAYAAAPSIRRLTILGGVAIAAWVVPHLVVMAAAVLGDGELDVVWGDPAWRVELVGGVAVLAFAAALLVDAREPWALRPGRLRRGNWHDAAAEDADR